MMLVLLPVALAMSELDIEGETGPVFLSETLPSGLSVSILADPALSVVATQMWVNVGSAHEASNEKGFAHLFEHLMFGETSNHGKEDYSRYHTIHGGDENAGVTADRERSAVERAGLFIKRRKRRIELRALADGKSLAAGRPFLF